jgi:hypothetical protein
LGRSAGGSAGDCKLYSQLQLLRREILLRGGGGDFSGREFYLGRCFFAGRAFQGSAGVISAVPKAAFQG